MKQQEQQIRAYRLDLKHHPTAADELLIGDVPVSARAEERRKSDLVSVDVTKFGVVEA